MSVKSAVSRGKNVARHPPPHHHHQHRLTEKVEREPTYFLHPHYFCAVTYAVMDWNHYYRSGTATQVLEGQKQSRQHRRQQRQQRILNQANGADLTFSTNFLLSFSQSFSSPAFWPSLTFLVSNIRRTYYTHSILILHPPPLFFKKEHIFR